MVETPAPIEQQVQEKVPQTEETAVETSLLQTPINEAQLAVMRGIELLTGQYNLNSW